MADKVLRLIFKGVDMVSDTFDDITGADGERGIGGIAASLQGLIIPAGLAAGAVMAVGQLNPAIFGLSRQEIFPKTGVRDLLLQGVDFRLVISV